MRNTKWLRYSLASLTLIAGGLSGLLVACGDDDDNPVGPGNDAGNGDTGVVDGGATDAPNDQANPDATPPPPNAKLQLVNAATDFGPSNPVGAVRVCYGLGPSAIAPLPPLPDRKSSDAQPYPGVYIGTGGAVQGTGADLTTVPIVPYLMNAQSLAARGVVRTDAGAGPTCPDLLDNVVDAGGAFVEGVDYWKLPVIPANTFVKEKSFILVLTGCAGDSAATVAKCGAGFTSGAPGNGNLKVTVYEVDRATTVAADKIGTQFIHASPAGAAALGVGGIEVVPGYITTANDPTTFKGLSADGGAGPAVAVGGKTDFVQVEGVNVASDSFTANPSAANLAITLANVQLASYGANVPSGGAYRNGAAFTFIALGDPAESATTGDGAFNTKTFHYIALPNDPINEVYKP
ncbi:MAG: hypothetical protein KF850_34580 [Labilithrix sp.]|nr:hypothetical protein [Labilithrix sp.]